MSFMKNLAATGSYFRETARTMGLKGKIKSKQAQVRGIQQGNRMGSRTLSRAMQGGAVGGLSGRAASSLASDPSAFDGGASPRKKGGNGFR